MMRDGDGYEDDVDDEDNLSDVLDEVERVREMNKVAHWKIFQFPVRI